MAGGYVVDGDAVGGLEAAYVAEEIDGSFKVAFEDTHERPKSINYKTSDYLLIHEDEDFQIRLILLRLCRLNWLRHHIRLLQHRRLLIELLHLVEKGKGFDFTASFEAGSSRLRQHKRVVGRFLDTHQDHSVCVPIVQKLHVLPTELVTQQAKARKIRAWEEPEELSYLFLI